MESLFRKYYHSGTRLSWHIAFWLLFLLYHTLIIGSFEGRSYTEEMLWEAFDLPVKICATYLVLYVLLPRYFMKKKIGAFSILFALTLIGAAFLQRIFYFFIVNPLMQPDTSEAFFQLRLNTVFKTIFGIYPVVVLAAFIKVCKHWYEQERASQNLEKEKIAAELNFLKAQIHPHFLFNTLNNLYALTLKKSDKASELVLKLSQLLSYLLYEGNRQQVPLEKELEIIGTYIDLEKIRYGDRLEVVYSIRGVATGKEIAPMLLLPFVENSFKHGASQQLEQVWVRIAVDIRENFLQFSVANSKAGTSPSSGDAAMPSGIGLKNVMRRLALLYGDRCMPAIQDKEHYFQVDMQIPLTIVRKHKPDPHEPELLYN